MRCLLIFYNDYVRGSRAIDLDDRRFFNTNNTDEAGPYSSTKKEIKSELATIAHTCLEIKSLKI